MAYHTREKLSEYITNWHKLDNHDRPHNEEVFIDEFVDFIKDPLVEQLVTFDGDGSYFGKQITIESNSGFGDPINPVDLEIAYSRDEVIIYTANHEGFWVSPYLSMDINHKRFNRVMVPFFNMLHKVFGV